MTIVRASGSLGHGLAMCKQIQPAKIFYLNPGALKQLRAVHHKREALCSADRHIETVGVEQELRSARCISPSRGRHGNDNYRGFLPLKLIDRSNLHAAGKRLSQQIDLQIIRSNNQDIV